MPAGARLRCLCLLLHSLIVVYATQGLPCPSNTYYDKDQRLCRACTADTPHAHRGSTGPESCFCAFGICQNSSHIDNELGKYCNATGTNVSAVHAETYWPPDTTALTSEQAYEHWMHLVFQAYTAAGVAPE